MGIQVNVNIGQLQAGKLFHDRVELITGATSGIGLEIAKLVLSQGAKVIISGARKDNLLNLCNSMGENCSSVCFDTRVISSFESVLREADDYFGPINCLVNTAGISLYEEDMMNVTEDTWDAPLDINLKGPYFLTQSWIKYYRTKQLKWGGFS